MNRCLTNFSEMITKYHRMTARFSQLDDVLPMAERERIADYYFEKIKSDIRELDETFIAERINVESFLRGLATDMQVLADFIYKLYELEIDTISRHRAVRLLSFRAKIHDEIMQKIDEVDAPAWMSQWYGESSNGN